MRNLTPSEVAATEATARAFQQGLLKRGLNNEVAQVRYAIEAHTSAGGFSIVVRDNQTKSVIAGVGPVGTYNEQMADATGDALAARIESMMQKETLAGGEAMLRGQRVLEEYVKGSVANTPFASEPIAELESEDFGIGNSAISVYATDSAIAKLGVEGMAFVKGLDGETLADAVRRASRHVFAKLDVGETGTLVQTLRVR